MFGALAWAPAVMFAFYFTIMTQIWPWYMLWALALGALKPESLAAKWAVALSAGMMTLYFFLSYYCGIDDWLSCYRSIPTIVIPSLGVLLYAAWKKRATTVNPAAL